MATRQKGATPPAPVVANGHDVTADGTDTNIEIVDTGEPVIEADVVTDPPLSADAGIEALQRQLDDERRKREAAEREAEQLRGARQNDQREVADSRLLVIDSTISAKETEKKAILASIVEAKEAGDYNAEVASIDKLTQINNDIRQASLGKARLENEIEQAKESAAADPFEQWIEQNKLPHRAAQWAREHKDVFSDARLNAKVQSVHFDAVADGVDVWSDEYFRRLEDKLGLSQEEPRQEEELAPSPIPRRQQAAPSAPVSRSYADAGGGAREIYPGVFHHGGDKYTVSREVAEIAAASGISPAEYVKQAQLMKRGSDGQMH